MSCAASVCCPVSTLRRPVGHATSARSRILPTRAPDVSAGTETGSICVCARIAKPSAAFIVAVASLFAEYVKSQSSIDPVNIGVPLTVTCISLRGRIEGQYGEPVPGTRNVTSLGESFAVPSHEVNAPMIEPSATVPSKYGNSTDPVSASTPSR